MNRLYAYAPQLSGISPDFDYSGDEGKGLIGSLSVLLKTGFFSTYGGTSPEPFYEISNPILNLYIQSATLNSKPLNQPGVLPETVVNGGTLTLKMGA